MNTPNLFFEIHRDMPREGPGDNPSTRRAFEMMSGLPSQPAILDIACGPGMQTVHLAQLSGGTVTAIDNHPPFLNQLRTRAEQAGISDQISALEISMFELEFPQQFDVLWCEGAIYIIGFEEGLDAWRKLLKPGGYLAVTEVSWLKPDPPEELRAFWEGAYPGMRTVQDNLQRIARQGYHLVGHFTLPDSAWWDNYYNPLQARIKMLREKYADSAQAQVLLDEEEKEIDLFRRYSSWYGYEFYMAQLD